MISIFPTSVFGQSAKEAYKALKKLEAKCQIGISYSDYVSTLGDAKYEVNLFLGSNAADRQQAISSSINKVIEHYNNILLVWRYKLEGLRIFHPNHDDINLPVTDPLGQLMLSFYPEAKLIVGVNPFGHKGIECNKLIALIMSKASEDLKEMNYITK